MLSANEKLKKSIKWEFLLIIFVVLIGFYVLPYLGDRSLGDNTGIDGIGQALGSLIIVRMTRAALAFLFLVVNPIRILIQYRNAFKEIEPKGKRIRSRILVTIPVLIAALIIFEVPLSNLSYHLKYNVGKGAYVADPAHYKSPVEFYEELSKRGLLFEEKDKEELTHLNSKYIGIDEKNQYYYYSEATMMALDQSYFYDTVNRKQFVTSDSEYTAPYYMYNAILTLPDDGGKMHYAPIGRYDEQDYLSDNECPFFRDGYIECKLLYVDGDFYAIIGVSESYYIRNHYALEDEPYYVILSERESITTYVDGKYCPNGSIENHHWLLQMSPNTNQKSWVSNYKVRKVDKLDVDTINAIAAEIQEEYLKEK